MYEKFPEFKEKIVITPDKWLNLDIAKNFINIGTNFNNLIPPVILPTIVLGEQIRRRNNRWKP